MTQKPRVSTHRHRSSIHPPHLFTFWPTFSLLPPFILSLPTPSLSSSLWLAFRSPPSKDRGHGWNKGRFYTSWASRTERGSEGSKRGKEEKKEGKEWGGWEGRDRMELWRPGVRERGMNQEQDGCERMRGDFRDCSHVNSVAVSGISLIERRNAKTESIMKYFPENHSHFIRQKLFL